MTATTSYGVSTRFEATSMQPTNTSLPLSSPVGAPGSDSTLGAGVITCSYDGPRFQSDGETLQATISVACTGSCGSL